MSERTKILILFFLWAVYVFPQTVPPNELKKNVQNCFELVKTDPDKAFEEAKSIEKQARGINDWETELQAVMVQCIYFRGNNDFEKMMAGAKSLYKKANLYKSDVYEVIARRYLFEAYIFSGLPEKAFRELESGRELIGRLGKNDSLNITSKGDLFVAFSNYYSLKRDYENQLKYLNLAGREFEKMPDPEYRQKLLCVHYSNLAAVYNDINQLDSAKYYTQLSQAYNENFNRIDIYINNFWVLGNVAMKEENYQEALRYFKEAEKPEGYKNHLNVEDLYDNIILSYKKLLKKDSARIYEAKKDSLMLRITQNQNKSLHKLLKEKEEFSSHKFVYVFIFAIVVLTIIIYIVIRKNNLLAKQEKASQEYLETFSENQAKETYSQLLKMLETGDPAYINYFNEIFPGFSAKLLRINSQIIQSEIEFCSLLKLKIPTKDIARYKFITPKTVQNKKYLIRKKLHIPKEVDIYQWFDSL